MSKDALSQMQGLVQAAVRDARGDMRGDALARLAASLEPQVWLIVGAMPDLIAVGIAARSLDLGRLNWARAVLEEILNFDEQVVERIARGIVVLLDDEIRLYRERAKRRGQRFTSAD